MRALTDKQRQVLDFVERFVEAQQCSPTLREIGNHMGIRSTNGVDYHLSCLERTGYIARAPHKSRGVRVLRPLRTKGCCVDARADERARMCRKINILGASGYDQETLNAVLRRLGDEGTEAAQ